MIKSQYSDRFAYHFTHIDNLEGIIKNGLLSTNLKSNRGITHKDIANNEIQHRRSEMRVTCGPGGVVHDYVPFYFTKRSPMLLNVIKKKNVDQEGIIYLAIPIEAIEDKSVVFSNSSANTLTPPTFYSNADDLNKLNWDAIDSRVWVPKIESVKQQKMAELLIHNEIPFNNFSFLVVWNLCMKMHVTQLLKKYGVNNFDVRCDYISFDHHYFHDLNVAGRVNIVTGPKTLLAETKKYISHIKQNKPLNPRFKNIADVLEAISNNFGCIKELSDIDGLETDNPIHREDVGAHSRRVASLLNTESAFHDLSERERLVVTLAAYLHDIGKGPKSRWKDGVQKVDDTHPIKSLPMLRRILCEEIGDLSNREIRQIVTLVVYDDLVGDIIAHERNEEQMQKIIKIKSDVDMLILIAKCDMNSINTAWVRDGLDKIEELRARMYTYLEENL
ncbi:type II toxin-antitoxin system toxin DNA ADP-ribosyl transferase DarT [Klebsiella pneumoniae]|uniref:type II toxin-antitoxin system toxin DNA ADP-ribosyl transferase DarT n=1 Tax=Klebsiella pneumoniae TaxID=573 RepID=UPI004045EEB8